MAKYSRKTGSRKAKRKHFVPPKPYPDFPLTPQSGGLWMKKIQNPHTGKFKLWYFGHWGRIRNGKMERLPDDGWKEALELYKAQADDLHAGRTPRVKRTGEGTTLDLLRGRFLTAKSRALDAGEITSRTYFEYKDTTNLLITQFGKDRLVDDVTADDFESLRAEMAKRWGPVRLGNEIQKVKTIFKYGYESGLIDKPVRYGPQFKKPSASVLRRHRAKNGERMIEAAELRRLLDSLAGKEVETGRTDEKTGKPEKVTLAANPILRAMVLLGINCGFNNKDCADLPLTALDLVGGWCNFPRPKTGIARRCPLWAETVDSLKAAIAARPEPRSEVAAPLVFITTRGRPWITRGTANPVSVAARDAMKAVGIHRDGIGFATLRHVFRTVADGCRDQVAVNHVMGHSDPSMGAVYRERIDDTRLLAVAAHVRRWLFGDKV
jgi:integrase